MLLRCLRLLSSMTTGLAVIIVGCKINAADWRFTHNYYQGFVTLHAVTEEVKEGRYEVSGGRVG